MPKNFRQAKRLPEDEIMKLDATSSLSDVLGAFASAHSSPRPNDVQTWQTRFPNYRVEILELALTLAASETDTTEADWAGLRDGAGLPRQESVLRNATLEEQRASRLRFHKACGDEVPKLPPDADFRDFIVHFGTDYPTLAAHLDIAESIISHAGHGELSAPYGARLVKALASALETTPDEMTKTLDRSRTRPDLRFGTGKRYSFAELVDRSDMSAERKAYWLDE